MEVRSGFTMVEILTAILLLGILLIGSIKAMEYMSSAHMINEIRYLSLNRLDSEMSRLVMAYENINSTTFVETSGGVSKYKTNPTDPDDYGLKILSSDHTNLVEIKNVKGEFNVVDDGDLVGVLSWIESKDSKDVNISLSLEYPYRYNGSDDSYSKVWDFVESLNLKSSTKMK